jgi:hypothetical protein
MSEFDYPLHAENDNRSAQVIQLDNGKHMSVVAICTALCALAAGLAFYAYHVATIAEKETRMLEYYVNLLTNEAVAAGIHKNGDNYQKESEHGTRKE